MDALQDFLSQYHPAGDATDLPSQLKGRYDILSCLKHRDDRQVLLLRDMGDGTRLILKVAPLERKALLEREHQVLMRLHDGAFPHPMLCFASETHAFLVREYVPGRSLSELVEDEGPLGEGRAISLALQVCGIAGRLHGCTPPVVHRDIKPQNLILSPDGSLHLVDLDAAEDVHPEKTADTVVMGTVATAAPEQFGFQRCDERTDVYAIGVLILYLTTGETAHSALKNAAVSGPLRRIAAKCLQFDPRRRFHSVESLRKRLQSLGHHGVLRMAAAAASLVLILALAAAATFFAPHISDFFESANALANEPAYQFASPLVEKAVRLQLGRHRGRVTSRDLRSLIELDLCGNTPFSSWQELDSRGRLVSIGGAPCDSRAVLEDASDFANMPNLRRLSLYRLSIQDIGFLRGLPLTHLGLGGNRIRDLNALRDFNQLRALDVSDNPIQDLDPILDCPLLNQLDISATGVVNLSQLEGMRLRSLELYDMPGGTDYSPLQRLDGVNVAGAN